MNELFKSGIALSRGGKWVVLLQKAHNSIEVAHIFANHKCKVTSMDLFVVNYVVSDLVASPLSVGCVGQDIFNSSKYSDGHSADILEWDQVSLPLTANEISVVVGKDLEAVFFQILSIVQNSLDTGTVGLMAHIDGESVIVIQFWVLVDEKLGDKLAE